jgi:hypothetical protein
MQDKPNDIDDVTLERVGSSCKEHFDECLAILPEHLDQRPRVVFQMRFFGYALPILGV